MTSPKTTPFDAVPSTSKQTCAVIGAALTERENEVSSKIAERISQSSNRTEIELREFCRAFIVGRLSYGFPDLRVAMPTLTHVPHRCSSRIYGAKTASVFGNWFVAASLLAASPGCALSILREQARDYNAGGRLTARLPVRRTTRTVAARPNKIDDTEITTKPFNFFG